jgi:hypothetical protein
MQTLISASIKTSKFAPDAVFSAGVSAFAVMLPVCDIKAPPTTNKTAIKPAIIFANLLYFCMVTPFKTAYIRILLELLQNNKKRSPIGKRLVKQHL